MKIPLTILGLFVLAGCAGAGPHKLNPGPEFNQKVQLYVSDNYQNFQAARNSFDVGDLQAFHSQQTFPILVEDAFKEIFGQVELLKGEPGIETAPPAVPAVFEVQMIDMSHDVYMEADSYRAEVTVAVAMKSPRGEIFWQQAFRGEGHVAVDPQFSTGLGPQDAIVDAVGDALSQMQEAILKSPEVKNQLKYYTSIEEARLKTETHV